MKAAGLFTSLPMSKSVINWGNGKMLAGGA